MMRKSYLAVLSIALFAGGSSVFATNGMRMTSYGVRYGGMGGASLALGGSVLDLATNPSQLARQKEAKVEGGINWINMGLEYEDQFIPNPQFQSVNPETYYYSNDRKGESEVIPGMPGFPLPYFGYTTPIGDNMGFGIALYAEGGGGAKMDGILRHTPGRLSVNDVMNGMLGTTTANLPLMGNYPYMAENVRSFIAHMRLTPGFAIRFGDLSIGAGVDLGMSKMEWSWTFSDPMGLMELPGAGYRYRSDVAYSLSGKVGLTYDISDRIAVAYSYQALARQRFDGDMSVNMGNPNFYKKNNVSNYIDWPESHNAGIAFKATEALTVAFDMGYIKWASAMNSVEFVLDQPWIKLPTGNYTNVMAFNMKWSDQPVYKLGLEYKPGNLAYRIGHNYGRSPVSGAGLNPLFPVMTENHTTVGLGYDSGALTYDFAVEYAHPKTVKGDMMSDWTLMHAMVVDQVCDVPNCDFLQARGTPRIPETFLMNAFYGYSITASQINPQFAITYRM
jgi:long-chain fatty acid transport protein